MKKYFAFCLFFFIFLFLTINKQKVYSYVPCDSPGQTDCGPGSTNPTSPPPSTCNNGCGSCPGGTFCDTCSGTCQAESGNTGTGTTAPNAYSCSSVRVENGVLKGTVTHTGNPPGPCPVTTSLIISLPISKSYAISTAVVNGQINYTLPQELRDGRQYTGRVRAGDGGWYCGDTAECPVAFTAAPLRPAYCQSATISGSTLATAGSLTITSTANTDLKKFIYNFYNRDNLSADGGPKPIYFVANTIYSITNTKTTAAKTNTVTVNYSDLNKSDLNWNSQKPTNIQVNAYFIDDNNNTSAPNAACVVSFNLSNIPPTVALPTPDPLCVCGTDDICNTAHCTFEGSSSTQIKCSRETSVAGPTPGADHKKSYCQRPRRTKGDANGDYVVDQNDYAIYLRAMLGVSIAASDNPDFDGNGMVSPADLTIFKNNYNP